MSTPVDLYHSTYGHFTDDVLAVIRRETFGIDIGQDSWLTADEYDGFLSWLGLAADHRALDVASGSGGPALYLAGAAGCRVTGVDANEAAIRTASELAVRSGHPDRARFVLADANARLPFEDESFDALVCIDAMNHFTDRLAVLQEWTRLLRAGGRAVFTDPVVVTGPVTNGELARRSSIGDFLFVPPGVNERLIEQAGLRLVKQEDVTSNAALTAGRWHQARQRHRDALIGVEGDARFEGLQSFFETVHQLATDFRELYISWRSRPAVRLGVTNES
ncbi:MAG: class I SAM-dependent methyltransferase [bacterium]